MSLRAKRVMLLYADFFAISEMTTAWLRMGADSSPTSCESSTGFGGMLAST